MKTKNRKLTLGLTLLLAVIPNLTLAQDKSNDILLLAHDDRDDGQDIFRYMEADLDNLLAATPSFTGQVDLDVNDDEINDRQSLLHSWYAPSLRDSFRAKIASGYKYVIIASDLEFASRFPEHYFEELHVISQAAVKAGSIPVVAMRTDDANDPEVLKTVYRAARGCGMEVIPFGKGIEFNIDALGGRFGYFRNAKGKAQRAFVGAAGIYHYVTGGDASTTGYVPTYIDDTNGQERNLDVSFLANIAISANNTYNSQTNYSGDYAMQGNIHYRTIDTEAVFDNQIWHIYRGTSSEDFQADRAQIILNDPSNELTGSKREVTVGNRFLKFWDSQVHNSSQAKTAFSKGQMAFLHVRGVLDGITGDEIKTKFDQPNLLPIVFERPEYAYENKKNAAGTLSFLENYWDNNIAGGVSSLAEQGWRRPGTALPRRRWQPRHPGLHVV